MIALHIWSLYAITQEIREDALNWTEDNCGSPGTHCDHVAPWMAGLAIEKSVYDGLDTSYQQYNLNIEAEYSLWAETSASLLCPCGSF